MAPKLYDTHPGTVNTVPGIREALRPGEGHRVYTVTAFVAGESKATARKALCAAGVRAWQLNELRAAEGEWADMIAKSGLVDELGTVAVMHSQTPERVALVEDGAEPRLAGEFSKHEDGGRVLTLLDGSTFRP